MSREMRLTKDDALGTSIVAAGQCAESFLASSVPNGQLDPVVLDCHVLQAEVYPYTEAMPEHLASTCVLHLYDVCTLGLRLCALSA